MATPKSLDNLEKTKQAVSNIRERLQPVLQRLKDDEFGADTEEAQASLALSVGMMRYMGARLQGLDQGRKPDDLLRKELNNMKKVLADIKKRKKTPAADSTLNSTDRTLDTNKKPSTTKQEPTIEPTMESTSRHTTDEMDNDEQRKGRPKQQPSGNKRTVDEKNDDGQDPTNPGDSEKASTSQPKSKKQKLSRTKSKKKQKRR